MRCLLCFLHWINALEAAGLNAGMLALQPISMACLLRMLLGAKAEHRADRVKCWPEGRLRIRAEPSDAIEPWPKAVRPVPLLQAAHAAVRRLRLISWTCAIMQCHPDSRSIITTALSTPQVNTAAAAATPRPVWHSTTGLALYVFECLCRCPWSTTSSCPARWTRTLPARC